MEEGSLGRSLGQEIPQINNHKKGAKVRRLEQLERCKFGREVSVA